MTNGTGSVGWPDPYSGRSTADLLMIADSGRPEERAVLATTLGLPINVMVVLANDDDVQVASSLAWNPDAPTDVLARLAERHPGLRSWIAANVNAPTWLKDLLKVGEHSGYSIERYLDDVGASANERRRLLSEHNRTPAREGRELGIAWLEIRAKSAND